MYVTQTSNGRVCRRDYEIMHFELIQNGQFWHSDEKVKHFHSTLGHSYVNVSVVFCPGSSVLISNSFQHR